jgi:hypothetical protein
MLSRILFIYSVRLEPNFGRAMLISSDAERQWDAGSDAQRQCLYGHTWCPGM